MSEPLAPTKKKYKPRKMPQPAHGLTRHVPSKHNDPALVVGLDINHPAVLDNRTLFPSTVVSALKSPRLLISGENSRKIGKRVTKGRWNDMPIYTLTLEERATCPTNCAVWTTCYGNQMHYARRHRPGPMLQWLLTDKVQQRAYFRRRCHSRCRNDTLRS